MFVVVVVAWFGSLLLLRSRCSLQLLNRSPRDLHSKVLLLEDGRAGQLIDGVPPLRCSQGPADKELASQLACVG